MKFLPVINLWDRAIHAAIKSGQLKLQRGQYVSCGGKPYSRWIGTNGVTLECVHGANNKEVNKRFISRCNIKKDTVKRFGKE